MILLCLHVELLEHGHGGCGITDEVNQWMERIQNSAVDDDPTPVKSKKLKTYKSKNTDWPYDEKYSLNKYSREVNEIHSRPKRATRRDENRNTCSLYIQTDPLIYRHIREGFPEVSAIYYFSFNSFL